ncbi:uncharacterized protein [Rutidosis leptorrhynchoides]|uniref:uncharacterized protein n=1 Tax=Rutidosis leptorrhynchoides TaxID=125765 RepID=UPI003A991A4A
MAGDQSQSSNQTIDITSPYFLTSADHPGQNFVGDNLLKDGNYSDWKAEMTNALFTKNKFCFVDGTLPIPDEGSNDRVIWQRCNAMVRSWLVSSMNKELKNIVKYATTARAIWDDLKERFDKENAPRAYELRRTITSVHQEIMTVSAYYTKLRGIWDEIQSVSPSPSCTCNRCTCNVGKSLTDMRDKEKLYDFLMGLNEEYSGIRSQILSISPLPSLVAAFHMVNVESSAFQVSGKKQQGKSWATNRRDDRSNEECAYCKKPGHTMEGCFELIGYPDWWTKKAKGSKNQTNRFKDQHKTAAVHDHKHTANLSREDIEHLLQLIKESKAKDTKPIANTTGLTLEEPDWDG